MIKKYLLITLLVSQCTLLKAQYILEDELFQNIVHRNETLRQLGRQVTSDPFEENIISSKTNFVTQQNKALSTGNQTQYLLTSEEKIQDLKKKLLFEQQRTNTEICLWQLIFTVGIFKSINEIEKEHNPSDYILCGIFGLITAGLQFLTTDTQPAIDSYANSIYTIRTLKIEIQQQQTCLKS